MSGLLAAPSGLPPGCSPLTSAPRINLPPPFHSLLDALTNGGLGVA
ncbi:hypothetical protein [Pseudomonas taeanensis]|nr:hypothetical protein [Pseudomonas taeanensis]